MIEQIELQVGESLSGLQKERAAITDEYLNIDIWDETHSDYLLRLKLQLNG